MVALLDNSGGRRWGGETIAYSAFGVPFGRPGADANGDGTVSVLDFNIVFGKLGDAYGDPGYTVLADINLDGVIDSGDSAILSAQFGHALGRGTLSRSPSLAGGVGNRVGYAGYAWEASASKYHVRNRVLDPVRGRWNRRDALGYIDGPTMYAYVSNRAMSAVDPSGLFQRKIPQLQPVCPTITEAGEDGEFALGECAGMGGGASMTAFTIDACRTWCNENSDFFGDDVLSTCLITCSLSGGSCSGINNQCDGQTDENVKRMCDLMRLKFCGT